MRRTVFFTLTVIGLTLSQPIWVKTIALASKLRVPLKSKDAQQTSSKLPRSRVAVEAGKTKRTIERIKTLGGRTKNNRGKKDIDRRLNALTVKLESWKLTYQIAYKPGQEGIVPEKETLELLKESKDLLASELLSFSQEQKLASSFKELASGINRNLNTIITFEAAHEFERLYMDTLYRAKVLNHETATEYEFIAERAALEEITTTDGTLGPLLALREFKIDDGVKLPPFLAELSVDKRLSVKWEDLTYSQKMRTIEYVIKARTIDVSKPKIEGLVLKKKEEIDYLIKTQALDIAGPMNNGRIEELEFKRRAEGLASDNLDKTFIRAQSLKELHLQAHIHVPGKIPRRILEGNPVSRFALLDWYRRLNMYLELTALQDGFKIAKKEDKEKKLVFFDSLTHEDLFLLNKVFWLMYRKESENGSDEIDQLDNELKTSYVGFRGKKTYDGEPDFGMEIRHLPLDKKKRANFVNMVQRGVLTEDYGIPYYKYSILVSGFGKQNPGLVKNSEEYNQMIGLPVVYMHYNIPIDMAFDVAPDYLKRALTGPVRAIIREHEEKNHAVKMLINDWTKDRLVVQGDKARSRIMMAQLTALGKIALGGDPDIAIKNFAKRSGLAELYGQSLGL